MADYRTEYASLSDKWQKFSHLCADAKAWTKKNRVFDKSVDMRADGVIAKLDRCLYRAALANNASSAKAGIGLFGESQAGKSYLVSILASDASGQMKIDFGGRGYDFISEINPDGSGKEATGVVTRLSTSRYAIPDARYPVRLKLLSVCEIAKILINSFFCDFSDIAAGYDIGTDIFNKIIGEFSSRKTSAPDAARNDVISLQEYLEKNFRHFAKKIPDEYWYCAKECVIGASARDMARFFSLLWGDSQNGESCLAEFTKLFERLAGALSSLDAQHEVFAPLESLLRKIDGRDNPKIPIINVDSLKKLDCREEDSMIGVIAGGIEKRILLSELSALTSELCLTLKNTPSSRAVADVDLLDFPGYRGRLNLTSFAKTKSGVPDTASVFLRGKVAYLFEKFSSSYQVNSLIVCVASDKQVEVSMTKVITDWVLTNQGRTPEERSLHEPSILFALTKFDLRLTSSIEKGGTAFGESGLLGQTVLEKFGACDWFKNWSGTESDPKPLNNIFLLRKVGIGNTFISADPATKSEKSYRPEFADIIAELKNNFLSDADVAQYIKNAASKWSSVMELNDGGMKSVTECIDALDCNMLRIRTLKALLCECSKTAISSLSQWESNIDREEAIKRKKECVAKTLVTLQKSNLLRRFGDLFAEFSLSDYDIRNVLLAKALGNLSGTIADETMAKTSAAEYKNAEAESAVNSADDVAAMLFGEDGSLSSDFSLFADDEPRAERNEDAKGQSSCTASCDADRELSLGERIFRRWTNHVKSLPDDSKFDPEMMRFFGDEIIALAERSSFREKFSELGTEEARLGGLSVQESEFIVSQVKFLISDFVVSLGGRVNSSRQVGFSNGYPLLDEVKPAEPWKALSNEWFKTFVQEAVSNAASGGLSLPIAESERMNAIISGIKDIRA